MLKINFLSVKRERLGFRDGTNRVGISHNSEEHKRLLEEGCVGGAVEKGIDDYRLRDYTSRKASNKRHSTVDLLLWRWNEGWIKATGTSWIVETWWSFAIDSVENTYWTLSGIFITSLLRASSFFILFQPYSFANSSTVNELAFFNCWFRHRNYIKETTQNNC